MCSKIGISDLDHQLIFITFYLNGDFPSFMLVIKQAWDPG